MLRLNDYKRKIIYKSEPDSDENGIQKTELSVKDTNTLRDLEIIFVRKEKMSTTSSHRHPAVGDIFEYGFGQVTTIIAIKDEWIMMQCGKSKPFVIHNNELMSSSKWKNQCPICFPPSERVMHKYRKKPIVIEAFQMTKERGRNNFDWPDWLRKAWLKGAGEGGMWSDPDSSDFFCGTLEDVTRVCWNDWVIQGVKGEIYPCKPDIFEETYEIVCD